MEPLRAQCAGPSPPQGRTRPAQPERSAGPGSGACCAGSPRGSPMPRSRGIYCDAARARAPPQARPRTDGCLRSAEAVALAQGVLSSSKTARAERREEMARRARRSNRRETRALALFVSDIADSGGLIQRLGERRRRGLIQRRPVRADAPRRREGVELRRRATAASPPSRRGPGAALLGRAAGGVGGGGGWATSGAAPGPDRRPPRRSRCSRKGACSLSRCTGGAVCGPRGGAGAHFG